MPSLSSEDPTRTPGCLDAIRQSLLTALLPKNAYITLLPRLQGGRGPARLRRTTTLAGMDSTTTTASTSDHHSPPRPKNYALLLISHGSPSPEWNDNQIQLLDHVKASLQKAGYAFAAVKWAWLEFAEPDIKQAMDELERQHLWKHKTPCAASGASSSTIASDGKAVGVFVHDLQHLKNQPLALQEDHEEDQPVSPKIDHVVAIPIFISVSSHSERDIPNCLNVRFTPERDDEMRRYLGRLPVTYASPMDHGRTDVLEGILADHAGQLCVLERARSTAVIVVSHGDGCEHFWGHLHARIARAIGKRVPGLKWNVKCYIQTLRKVGGWGGSFLLGKGKRKYGLWILRRSSPAGGFVFGRKAKIR